MYRTEFTDIIDTVVQAMDVSMVITGYSQSGTTHTIEVCDLKWVQKKREITVDGNTYTVTAINDETNTITATGDEPIQVSTFNLYRPKFFYGTPIDTENQLKKKKLSTDKFPMFWLPLNYREVNFHEWDNPIEREVAGRLLALGGADWEKSLTSDLHDDVIKPMARMMQCFINTLLSMVGIFLTDDFKYESIPQYKFGIFIQNKGTEKNLFTDNTSGWEMTFSDLKVWKGHNCTPCTPIVFDHEFDESFDESFA